MRFSKVSLTLVRGASPQIPHVMGPDVTTVTGHSRHPEARGSGDPGPEAPQGGAATTAPTVAEAVERFFDDRDLKLNTRRAYRQAYDLLAEDVGGEASVGALTAERLRALLEAEWGESAPATFNARRTALRSLATYCRRRGWIDHDPVAGIERRSRSRLVATS